MREKSRLLAVACFIIAACAEGPIAPVVSPVPDVGRSVGQPPIELLGPNGARIHARVPLDLAALAHQQALLGDERLLRRTRAPDGIEPVSSSPANDETPAQVTILTPNTVAGWNAVSASHQNGFIYVEQDHNGDESVNNTISHLEDASGGNYPLPDLHDARFYPGHWIAWPFAFNSYNRHGTRHDLSLSQNPCGLRIIAASSHEAYWVLTPVTPWDVTPAMMRFGTQTAVSTGNSIPIECVGEDDGPGCEQELRSTPRAGQQVALGRRERQPTESLGGHGVPIDLQPANECGPGGGSGGGGSGGGGGQYITVTECWGYDVYENGYYMWSVIEGCSTTTYFIQNQS